MQTYKSSDISQYNEQCRHKTSDIYPYNEQCRHRSQATFPHTMSNADIEVKRHLPIQWAMQTHKAGVISPYNKQCKHTKQAIFSDTMSTVDSVRGGPWDGGSVNGLKKGYWRRVEKTFDYDWLLMWYNLILLSCPKTSLSPHTVVFCVLCCDTTSV